MRNQGEQAIIERLLGGPLRASPTGQQPGDDAVQIPGGALVSVDTMVEGVHFDHRLAPADVGWKLVAVNASDIGACGRLPRWALLAISLPTDDEDWLDGFASGLQDGLAHWGVSLIGGDTTRSPGPRTISLTIGSAADGPFLTRAGALAGDDLWVTGRLGRAAAGFLHHTPAGLTWLRRPCPPVRFGAALGQRGLAHAMMDLSDGLAADLHRLCTASHIGADVLPHLLPRADALKGTPPDDALFLMTAFGEDYELLIAAPPHARAALRALADQEGVSIHRIGQCTPHHGSVTLGGGAWPSAGFSHF